MLDSENIFAHSLLFAFVLSSATDVNHALHWSFDIQSLLNMAQWDIFLDFNVETKQYHCNKKTYVTHQYKYSIHQTNESY